MSEGRVAALRVKRTFQVVAAARARPSQGSSERALCASRVHAPPVKSESRAPRPSDSGRSARPPCHVGRGEERVDTLRKRARMCFGRRKCPTSEKDKKRAFKTLCYKCLYKPQIRGDSFSLLRLLLVREDEDMFLISEERHCSTVM